MLCCGRDWREKINFCGDGKNSQVRTTKTTHTHTHHDWAWNRINQWTTVEGYILQKKNVTYFLQLNESINLCVITAQINLIFFFCCHFKMNYINIDFSLFTFFFLSWLEYLYHLHFGSVGSIDQVMSSQRNIYFLYISHGMHRIYRLYVFR